MTEAQKTALLRGLKQAARVALVSAVISVGTAMQAGKFDWRVLVSGAAVAAYEGVSKYIAANPEISLKGLYPF